jgi:capsular polysaccharide transport system permease protein
VRLPGTLLPLDEARRSLPWGWIAFVLVAVLPVVVVATYLFAFASDQYVSEFRFVLRANDPMPTSLGRLAGLGETSAAPAAESRIVVEYLTSRAIVDTIDPAVNLRRVYAPPDADWWARLDPAVPIETLTEYWRQQIDAYYDPADTTVVVRVRAFTPTDALAVAQAVVAACERLVNDLSARMRHDTLGRTEEEVAQAKARLTAALADIRRFRDRAGMIDPGRTAAANAALSAKLRDELARANAELATLRAYMRENAPAVRVVRARIRSLETQLQVVGQEVPGAAGARGPGLAGEISAYEQLESERQFAEDAYRHALASLDRARADADRQQVYITSFVPPTQAESALYPRRWRTLGVVALISFALWGIGSLTLQSVRDHL